MITKKNKGARESLERLVGTFTFAMFIRASRTTLDLTQIEMAEKIGITPSSLCDIEKGRTLVSVEAAARYAKKAGFSIVSAIEASLQDQLRKAHLDHQIQVHVSRKTGTKPPAIYLEPES